MSLTNETLAAIRERAEKATGLSRHNNAMTDRAALLAEVERLRNELDMWRDAEGRTARKMNDATDRLDKVRALADYWTSLADGDKHYGRRILETLDGGDQ
jgi:hypothetical protein